MTTTASPAPVCFTVLAQRLAMTLLGLREAIAARAARAAREAAIVPLLRLLWTRIGRLRTRFDALVARLLAGHPAAPRRQRARPAGVAGASVPARKVPALRLPHGHAWLMRLLPSQASCYGTQLQALLAEPQMAALLAAAPEAGRILRPLCRLLGVWPEGLLALPSQAGKAAPKPRSVKVAPAAPMSAIAQIYAALAGQTPAAPPDLPARRKPPWLRLP